MRHALLRVACGTALVGAAVLALPASACSTTDWKACLGRPWVVGDQMETPLGERWWPHPVWGADDRAGATNWHARPEVVQRALAEARTGRVYRLSGGAASATAGGPQFEGPGAMAVNVPGPSGATTARRYNGEIAPAADAANAANAASSATGAARPAPERLHPILARGVLIDVAAARGVAALDAGQEITMADVRAALARQGLAGLRLLPGDAVLFRTGWKRPSGDAADVAPPAPGIGIEVARWLTDAVQAGLVGSDTPRTESVPSADPGCGACVRAHLLVRHGMPVHDSLDLDRLAADAGWRFLFVYNPGTPGAAPLAVR